MTCQMSGDCCRIFFINLSEAEYRSCEYKTQFEEFGFIDDFELASSSGVNILAKKDDDSCIYLENNKCSIYHKRPEVCKPFTCKSKDPQFMGMVKAVGLYRETVAKD